MASFELGKEIEKKVFSSCHDKGDAWDKGKILSLFEESHVRPADSAL